MHPGRKTKVQNLGTGPLDASMWMETSLIESLILRGFLSQVKIGFSRILQTKHNAADRPGSFSNERPQSYIVPGAFHLGVKAKILSMLRKHAW